MRPDLIKHFQDETKPSRPNSLPSVLCEFHLQSRSSSFFSCRKFFAIFSCLCLYGIVQVRLAASKPQLTCHEIPSTVFLLRKPDPFVIKQLNNLLPRLRPSVIQENDENEIFCHAKTSNANLRALKMEDWGEFS